MACLKIQVFWVQTKLKSITRMKQIRICLLLAVPILPCPLWDTAQRAPELRARLTRNGRRSRRLFAWLISRRTTAPPWRHGALLLLSLVGWPGRATGGGWNQHAYTRYARTWCKRRRAL